MHTNTITIYLKYNFFGARYSTKRMQELTTMKHFKKELIEAYKEEFVS